MLPDPENQVWMGLEYFCSEGDEMWNKSSEDFIAFAKEELLRIGEIGSPDAVNAYAASSFYAVDRYASYKKFWQEDHDAGVLVDLFRAVDDLVLEISDVFHGRA